MIKSKACTQQEYTNLAAVILEEGIESPQALKEGLGFLLNRYIDNHSSAIANKIVVQIEKLLLHADCVGFPNERCTYYRLLNYWRAKCL
jgi:hypothetical protein|tara:strand:- start:450 stop:716 length:267 start_codon:yes stop_codon:yes gene_type:complete